MRPKEIQEKLGIDAERMHERRNYRVPFRMMDIKLCERSCLHIFVILQS